MKLIVAGTRTFVARKYLKDKLDWLVGKLNPDELIVVTGACPTGADRMAEEWALKNRYTVVRYHTDWQKHGKKAGPLRNTEMVRACDALVAFWDGESPGTKDVIKKAKFYGLKIKVFTY